MMYARAFSNKHSCKVLESMVFDVIYKQNLRFRLLNTHLDSGSDIACYENGLNTMQGRLIEFVSVREAGDALQRAGVLLDEDVYSSLGLQKYLPMDLCSVNQQQQ